MAPFVTEVTLRWTDQDVYRHLNHAKAVTLLEEARIDLCFEAAAGAGVTGLAAGLLVVALHVDYLRQVSWTGHGLAVAMTVTELRGASFRLDYALHAGPEVDAAVAVRAWTRMATYDLAAQRPRRLEPDEREFLGRWAP